MFTDDDFVLGFDDRRFESNPYYSPEKWGLETIGEIELSEPSYSFDTIVFWKRIDGRVFCALDSGCSCPSPFEDLRSFADMKELTKDTINEVRSILMTSEYAMRNGAQDLMYKVRSVLLK